MNAIPSAVSITTSILPTNGKLHRKKLIARAQSRLDALKSAIDADSSKDGKIRPEERHPALGDAMSRMPRPFDNDHPNSKTDGDARYGRPVSQDKEPRKVSRFGQEKN